MVVYFLIKVCFFEKSLYYCRNIIIYMSKKHVHKGRVFHFSGGRTSAYMVIKYYKPGDLVVFCDTGREHEKTYKFIHDFEAHEGIPVIKIAYEGGWSAFLKAAQVIPSYGKRKCTKELKRKTARRYLRSLGWYRYTQFIGFRADEKTRVEGYESGWQAVSTEFPLYDDGICKPEILAYFKGKPYDLEIPAILGNCDLCFMKGESAIIAILTNEPERADRWIEDEEKSKRGGTYHKKNTMRQLRDFAVSLKKKYPLDEVIPKFNCSCTS